MNDKYKLNHCKEMGAESGRRFLIQPAAKLESESLLTIERCNNQSRDPVCTIRCAGWILSGVPVGYPAG